MGRHETCQLRAPWWGIGLRCMARWVGFFVIAGLGTAWGLRQIEAMDLTLRCGVLFYWVALCGFAMHIACATIFLLAWPTVRDAFTVFTLGRDCSWHALLCAGGLGGLVLAYLGTWTLLLIRWATLP